MKEKLKKLLANSYSPYSKVQVSSLLITKDGKEFTGVNVENASFGATICAERTAILKAISVGYTKNQFKEIHVASNVEGFLYPCSICRQVMSEFFEDDTKIHIHYQGQIESTTLEKLVPNRIIKSSFNWK